jgi:hypothetical protein
MYALGGTWAEAWKKACTSDISERGCSAADAAEMAAETSLFSRGQKKRYVSNNA